LTNYFETTELTPQSLNKNSQIVNSDSLTAHAQFQRPCRKIDGFGDESRHIPDRSHANSHVGLIGGPKGWRLCGHLRAVHDVRAFAKISDVAGYECPWESARLEAFVEDAACEDGVLDAASKVSQPIQSVCPLAVERVVGGSELGQSFELCRCEASHSDRDCGFDQEYLVGSGHC
jgi:hypothetical protein